MADLLSWPSVLAAVGIYVISLAFYRLTLHPLARFPGPKWAALTRYYEGYFDVIQNGQYTFKIAELHKQYGPIIRISPYELHVDDPAFSDVLYRQDAHYDKYDWAYNAFAATGATLFTISHNVHKNRRQPLAPFFAKAKVAGSQRLIRRHLDKLRRRLSESVTSGAPFHLGAATAAFARDVANDYILGKTYNSLDREDFDVAMLTASQGAGQIWRLTKFVRWVGPTMQSIPIPWIMKIAGEDVKVFFRHLQETQDDTRVLMCKAAASATGEEANKRTIVHEIMDSKLPPAEKLFERVFQDVSTVTGAGFETTASALRLILFHIFTNLDILQRLRAELTHAGAASDAPLSLKSLEQLPYLTAILNEGLRLSPAIATRMARVAPHTDLAYEKWRIPAGTPVGMTLILMHMDEKLYPEPQRFDPDRWLDGRSLKKIDRGFAPFSKGSRNCLGMNLAWAEMYIVIAELVQTFNFKFHGVSAEDFQCTSDQFAVGTNGGGSLNGIVTYHQT